MKLFSKLDDKLGVYFSYRTNANNIYMDLKAMENTDCWNVSISGDAFFSFTSSKLSLSDMMESYRELFDKFIEEVKPNCFSVPIPDNVEGKAINFSNYSGKQEGNFVIYNKQGDLK
jgi:hypothetical protein